MEIKMKIGQYVGYSDWGKEPFKLLSVKGEKVKLKGDWSGGTHHTIGTAWVNKSEIRKL
jgi:hypothetical protein